MIERLLNSNIYIGFHLHNNKQLAMANAILLLENSQRNIIIDSSIYGMGSGAGLLNTELLIEYLNDNYNDEYEIIPILEIMDSVVNNVYIKKVGDIRCQIIYQLIIMLILIMLNILLKRII